MTAHVNSLQPNCLVPANNSLDFKNTDMSKELGQWEVRSPNPVFREPSDWRLRHLRFYDTETQRSQPE